MKLLIADDHPLFRLGLKAALEQEGLEVLGEAVDGRSAVSIVVRLRPDAVLLDVKMPQLDGIAATKELRDQGFTGLIVLLTTFSEPALVHAAANAGADAYWSKEVSAAELAQKLMRLNGGLEAPLQPPKLPALTQREMQVLTYTVQGLSTKEIAHALSLSPETVKDYLTRVYTKLEVSNRIEAIERARVLGII